MMPQGATVSSLYSAILLLAINIGLLWLLMAAPIGMRTLRIRRSFRNAPGDLWAAIDPAGANADWHHTVISSQPVPTRPGIVEQTYRNLDRKGLPVRRLLAVQPTDIIAGVSDTHGYTAQIVDDSTLDSRFWRHFHERRQVVAGPEGAMLTVEQTDSYRGLAFLVFRYFALRREMRALEGWLLTGQSKPNGLFEHPLVQCSLAILSTLLLWPFFGLNSAGLMISTFLTLVIVLHELGHMAAYRTFGHGKVRMIFLPLLGGIAIGGRPYNSLFEVATCALMGPGMSAFFVPILVAAVEAGSAGWLPDHMRGPLLVFLLILGSFNLLNLLPMYRFDGGQVLRQIFVRRASLVCGSFGITLVILAIGWSIGLGTTTLLAALAVFILLSLIGFGSVKPKDELERMSGAERMLVSFGLYAAVAMHGYAVVYAARTLF
jgi:Zn-dependent protease